MIEAADKLRATARSQGYSREILHVDARFDWLAFREHTASLSLFSEKQLIECRLQQGRINDQGIKALQDFLEQDSEDCVLLLSPKIEASAKKTKWFKNLSAQITMQIIWPPQGQDFVRFLQQRASDYQLKLSRDALLCLAENTEGNLLAAKQILQQLSLMHDTVDVEHVQAQLHDASKFDIYQLVDTALAAKPNKTVRVFYRLLSEGTAPSLLLWALQREVKQILKLQEALAAGEDYTRLSSQYRIFGPRKSLLQSALRRLDGTQLRNMLPLMAQVDQDIKSQNADEGINQLLGLYISLSGAKININTPLLTY